MRKKTAYLFAAALAVLLVGGALGASGSVENSLISRDYLHGTFLDRLSGEIGQWVQDLFSSTYEQAEEKLDEVAQGAMDSGMQPPSGWESSGSFTAQTGVAGDTVTLSAGSGILWTAGSGNFQGTLVDVTQGSELSTGSALEPNHRYLAVEQTTITATSAQASWAVEGIWMGSQGGAELPFMDVPTDSWYYSSVQYVFAHGLYQGTSDTTFSPMGTMERKMITTVLHRLAGEPAVDYAPIFSDVPDGLWYSGPTVWAGENGIVNGVGDGRFAPGEPLVRQQIALVLYQYAGFVGADTSDRGDLSAFGDEADIAPWARDAVSWAAGVGILKGAGGNVSPGAQATRAEVAAMLERFDTWLG